MTTGAEADAAADPSLAYVSSTLDTALALPVSSDETVHSLKRKLEQEHAVLFPETGEIIVKFIKQEKKGCVYHLADSVPLRRAFDGVEGCHFLDMEAVPASQQDGDTKEACVGKKTDAPLITLIEPYNQHGNEGKSDEELEQSIDTNKGYTQRSVDSRTDLEEACEREMNAPVIRIIKPHNQHGNEGKSDEGLEQSINTMEGHIQRGGDSGTDTEEECDSRRKAPVNGIIEPRNQNGNEWRRDEGLKQGINAMGGYIQRREDNRTGKTSSSEPSGRDSNEMNFSIRQCQLRNKCINWLCKQNALPGQSYCGRHERLRQNKA